MYLNKNVENAVIIVRALKGMSEAVSIYDISKSSGISYDYLSQIAVKLRRAGIIHSVRGPGGGYYLKKQNVTLLDLSNAFPTQQHRKLSGDPVLESKVMDALGMVTVI